MKALKSALMSLLGVVGILALIIWYFRPLSFALLGRWPWLVIPVFLVVVISVFLTVR